MAHAESSITIDRPAKQVFEFVLNGANGPLWRPDTIDAELKPGKPLGVGAVFKQGMKGPGGRIDADYEITDCTPNELIKFQVVAGPARPTGIYTFASSGDSTKVSFVLDFQPKGLAKLMNGMINKSMQAEVGNLSNLKTYLETH